MHCGGFVEKPPVSTPPYLAKRSTGQEGPMKRPRSAESWWVTVVVQVLKVVGQVVVAWIEFN